MLVRARACLYLNLMLEALFQASERKTEGLIISGRNKEKSEEGRNAGKKRKGI